MYPREHGPDWQIATSPEHHRKPDPTARAPSMSFPPNIPEEKRGIWQLLGSFGTLQPRSNSQSLPQPGPRMQSLDTECSEGSNEEAQKGLNVAWNGLRVSLNLIEEASSAVSSLRSAITSLVSCLGGFEEAVQNHPEFEVLATELTTVTQSLNYPTSESSPLLASKSVTRFAMLIEMQAIEIRNKLEHPPSGDKQEAIMAEDLVRCYQNIQSHFRKLQENARMRAWSIMSEASVKKYLNPANQANYDSTLSSSINRRRCTEGTRIGVLDTLEKWLCDLTSPSIYWMNGMAGTGKTTIASTFCARVNQRKLLAASFFCTRSSPECRNVALIVPTIAYQLAQYSIPFQSALCKILGQTPDIGSKDIFTQFEQLLKEPLQQVKDAIPDNLVVVIDALDECESRNGVELVLDMLFRHAAQVPLKFLVTSRPEREIYAKMSMHTRSQEVLHLHEIESSLVQADIELYLMEELEPILPTCSRAEMEQLAQRSGALFIYAATLVRYIFGKRSADPYRRLRSILDTAPESTKHSMQIDALYAAVLKAALTEDEINANEVEDIWAVLRTVLLAQEPISVETIAKLADINDSKRVILALQPLRSVLYQSETNDLVSTLHASFPDFMFSNERSGPYFCDAAKHSQLMVRGCFFVMKEQLRFNICDLESSFLPDEKVENIQELIKTNISPTLAYACRYWANHLAFTTRLDILLTMLEEFLYIRLLFWMEVLSLRREMLIGIDGLLKAQQWLMRSVSPSSEIILFIDDARSFITGFAVNPTSHSTPHIYISSLPFCPRSSLVHKYYRNKTKGLLELKGSVMEHREAAPLAIWTMSSEVQALALSPDGTRVAIGCLDKTVSILSAYYGTVHIGPLRGHTNSITSVAFSPDGGLIASASLGTFRVWNAHNGTLIAGPFIGHMRHVNSVSFSPHGTHVVTGGHDCTIRVWDIYKRTLLLGPLTGDDVREGYILCVAFSPNGTLIASGSADKTVRLWYSKDGTPAASPFKGHTGWVESLVFTPDGKRIISGSGDGTIRVWNTLDGSIFCSSFEGCVSGIKTLAVSLSGTRIVAGSGDRAVRVWKVDDGALVAGPFFGHTEPIRSVAFSPDGTRVFSGSSDKTIHVWNVRDGNFPPPPLQPQDALIAIKSITFCPDNRHILSSDEHGIIRKWDMSDGSFKTLPSQGTFFPTPLSMLSGDGSCIASTSKSGHVQIVNTSDASLVTEPLEVERASLSALSFSHNARAIIMGCQDGTIKFCDLQSRGAAIGTFKGHPRGVSSLTESPDCSLLVSYSDYENVLRVWNIVTPALDLQLSNRVIHSTSGRNYAAVHDGWRIREDGWVVNNSHHLLFWLPPDLASAWCSPYATLVITRFGMLQVPKQKPFIGDRWVNCYVPQ